MSLASENVFTDVFRAETVTPAIIIYRQEEVENSKAMSIRGNSNKNPS